MKPLRCLRQLAYAAAILTSFCATIVVAQDAVEDCPPQGTAKRARVMLLNEQKNRSTAPDSAIIRVVTLDDLLQGQPPGRGTLHVGDAVQTTAYVADVRLAGAESCNCMASDHWRRDTHIELTMQPMNAHDKTRLVVAEITPRMRERMKSRGIDWSHRALRDMMLGRWVRITGWLFYDELHADESASTGDGAHIWRGTAWEIHPVTDVAVVDGPYAATAPVPAQGSAQCRAVTTKGKRCSRRTTDASGLCWQHKK